MAAISSVESAPAPKHDKLKALGIVALNGMFDEMDAEAVLRQGVELLNDDIAGRLRHLTWVSGR